MLKNSIPVVVGLTLLPASAFSLQNKIDQVPLEYFQESQHDTAMPVVFSTSNPITGKTAARIQLAQSDTPADSARPSTSNQSNQYPAPTTARNLEKIRTDKIKSIVSEVDANAIPDQSLFEQSQPSEQIRKVNSPQERRQQLKDLVVGAPPAAKDKRSKSYVSELQDEVSSTVVIDEESARRIAAPASAIQPSSSEKTAMSKESGDSYLYTVRNGDSLWRIAERFYQDPYRYVDICRANQEVLINEDMLHVGQVLRVPKTVAKN